MAADDLSAPLGLGTPRKRPHELPRVAASMLATVLSLFVVLLAGWAIVGDDRFGGDPIAVVPIELARMPATGRSPDEARAGELVAAGSARRDDRPPTDLSPPTSPRRAAP
jgi:hypothetical protein